MIRGMKILIAGAVSHASDSTLSLVSVKSQNLRYNPTPEFSRLRHLAKRLTSDIRHMQQGCSARLPRLR